MSNLNHAELGEMLRSATVEVFSTMLNMPLVTGESYLDDRAPVSSNGVVSFIGMTGPQMGSGSISCSAAVACTIAQNFLMGEYAAVDDEVLDAFAEVTNMVLGNVKTSLEERLGPMGLSIPTCVYGRNFKSRTNGKQEWTVVPFFAGEERIEVQLFLTQAKEDNRSRSLASAEVIA